jgi:hypothetical protein
MPDSRRQAVVRRGSVPPTGAQRSVQARFALSGPFGQTVMWSEVEATRTARNANT